MFRMESYVTPILLSYVDKYVRDFNPADAQVSLWGGGVALHNLVLKADVLQQEVALPFTLLSGRIHELLIHVPWTKIIYEPIVVTIDTIECILSLRSPEATEGPSPNEYHRRTAVVEAPPGYMQALVRRIVSNISVRVHHLIVKYVQDDIVLSLNVKHVAVDTASALWQPAFADIDHLHPVLRRIVRLDDLTLCLDRADADGKIRFYQEPLLYRCQLDLRILTQLVSASSRRATSISVQLFASKLAWGITSDQLLLILRLLREYTTIHNDSPQPAPKVLHPLQPTNSQSSHVEEPARSESWSEWAWSWLPTWLDKDTGTDEAPTVPTPIPLHFAAYLDSVSFSFKVMEVESSSRKRALGILELVMSHVAVKKYICAPTISRMRFGLRELVLRSNGKCVCGYSNNLSTEGTAVYVSRLNSQTSEQETWSWPEENMQVYKIDPAEVANEHIPVQENADQSSDYQDEEGQIKSEEFAPEYKEALREGDVLWSRMEPVVFMELAHERAPPNAFENPYEKPPLDFEYSDWVEHSNLNIVVQPMLIRVTTGLIHRLATITNLLSELPPLTLPEIPMRTLTVEECDALLENLPQRHITAVVRNLHLRFEPLPHSLHEKYVPPSVMLEIELPKTTFAITVPIYPLRVCQAACQLPEDSGPLWQGARAHLTLITERVEARICSPDGGQVRPCARLAAHLVLHRLLHPEYFVRRQSVRLGYSLKLREVNVCGSSARLQAACHIIKSLLDERVSSVLSRTTLPKDALYDEELVALDMTLEEVWARGYITGDIIKHVFILQAARATVLHSPIGGEVKQAWLFSAPDASTSTPFVRLAVQWCKNSYPGAVEYVGVFSEPAAVCIDPLFIAWLAYCAEIKPTGSQSQHNLRSSSSQSMLRRRTTPPSSSGRGGTRSGSGGAELIHATRVSRLGSCSDKVPSVARGNTSTERTKTKAAKTIWDVENLLPLYERLKHMSINVELGLVLLYVTMSTASAVDCATVREACERHAAIAQKVFTLSLGRLSMANNAIDSTRTKHFWQEICQQGPTFKTNKNAEAMEPDKFPWKIRLADVSCYTLDVRAAATTGRVKSSSGLRSQLKVPCVSAPRTILELITTTITLSVVTKSLQLRSEMKVEHSTRRTSTSPTEDNIKYFTSGIDFKPTTLKEFVRGPARRRKSGETENNAEQKGEQVTKPTPTSTCGPLITFGVHIHVDTPPIIVRLDHDQVQIVAVTAHCFMHLLTLLQRNLAFPPRDCINTSDSHRSLFRSVSEEEMMVSQNEETASEKSELIPIYESQAAAPKLKTFFWFQWVVSRATLVVASAQVKLAFDADDIISTIDLQKHYNQYKIKIASASIKHYQRFSADEWIAGLLGGRVLEAREPTNDKEDGHFLAITVTQAQISNLPPSWKEELHPKLLQQKPSMDSMWEIYAVIAPLEAVLQPTVLDNIMSLAKEVAPRALCPLRQDVSTGTVHKWQWPFCYITAGGVRLMVTTGDQVTTDSRLDDTFLFVIGKVTVNPHPENPIFRRVVAAGIDTTWSSAPSGHLEGRQYELVVKNVALSSAKFRQLVDQEIMESSMKGTAGENPAHKWAQPQESPAITPLLHNVEISLVIAPTLFVGGILTCGPATELNILTDCTVEVSIYQLKLLRRIYNGVMRAASQRLEHSQFEDESPGVCPYATLLMNRPTHSGDDTSIMSDIITAQVEVSASRSQTVPLYMDQHVQDSGVDTVTSHSTRRSSRNDDAPIRKQTTLAENSLDPSEFLEVFVTMGAIEMSLYATEDDAMQYIKDPRCTDTAEDQIPVSDVKVTVRENTTCHIPLLQVKLHQPNLYYWRKRSEKSVQMSLFNAWIGVGAGQEQTYECLLSTARGVPDPTTDIPPALATVNIVLPCNAQSPPGGAGRTGSVKLVIERPILLDVTTERVYRLLELRALIARKLFSPTVHEEITSAQMPSLFRLRRILQQHSIDDMTIETSQIGVSGSEGSVGFDSSTSQLSLSTRPSCLIAKTQINALLIATRTDPNPSEDCNAEPKHVLLAPLTLCAEAQAKWKSWRRAEGGCSPQEADITVRLEFDQVEFHLRPEDLAVPISIQNAFNNLRNMINVFIAKQRSSSETEEAVIESGLSTRSASVQANISFASNSTNESTEGDHYYRDDLRSGAFKIVRGGQLPMAYQVMLHEDTVSWRYPHPRAITRLIAFPLPNQDEEVQCVLELYNSVLKRWESHTYLSLPVSEPRELNLAAPPPEMAFATMWRFRAYTEKPTTPPFDFNAMETKQRENSTSADTSNSEMAVGASDAVTALQLSGVLRVDSYFAPRHLPRIRIVTRFAEILLHLYCARPDSNTHDVPSALEGYYVSKPLMRSHRVLSVLARDTSVVARLASPSASGTLFLLVTNISSDMLDTASGIMEEYISETRLQAGLSLRKGASYRTRMFMDTLRISVHATRLRTLQTLFDEWRKMLNPEDTLRNTGTISEKEVTSQEISEEIAANLEGLVSLWVHNSCSVALRIGQEGTDNVTPLSSGARLAYRWTCPVSPKKIHFAIAGPATDWQWSPSIPFSTGTYRLKLHTPESTGSDISDPGEFLYVKVQEVGTRLNMDVSGRLMLANMMRFNLLFKVKSHAHDTKQWRTETSGELSTETVGQSVICSLVCDMVLKIKLTSNDSGWSGDIPLKECSKQNVPWLVKIPNKGDMPYISVWCRVVRAKSDDRILAAIWPLYVLHSYLPLSVDVIIRTEPRQASDGAAENPPPLVLTAPGRGHSTHLLTPATTHARHSLTFQYRKIDCPVTREAVPLHYGVTETSVFVKQVPVYSIEEVITQITSWLERSGRHAVSAWPYSTVSSHLNGTWQSALLQPRCDVTIRYRPVHAGGGCSLEMLLCPLLLFCNASPLALTLRAHDAAPLCKVESGAAVAPPAAPSLLTKPFFISMEVGREIFVSGQMQIWTENLGQYGEPPTGAVALDREANLAILCGHKVALLTMFYEIKEEINVIGITTTHVLINSLKCDVMISAIAVPDDMEKDVVLQPKCFKLIPPTPEGSIHGTPVPRFWLHRRWRNADPRLLRLYICVALTARAPVPIPLMQPRRSLSLHSDNKHPMAVVVTQVKHEGRWVIRIAKDPCPQFLVQNQTRKTLLIAQPIDNFGQPNERPQVEAECAGVSWWCSVEPGALTYYSSPDYNARYPPTTPPTKFSAWQLLTFARPKEDVPPLWCSPVSTGSTEQLVQLHGGSSIKLCVRIYPHSTIIQLQDVHQLDISASDIRNRLLDFAEAHSTNDNISLSSTLKSAELPRVDDTQKSDFLSKPVHPTLKPPSIVTVMQTDSLTSGATDIHENISEPTWCQSSTTRRTEASEAVRCVIQGLVVEFSPGPDAAPLLALHLERSALLVHISNLGYKACMTVADMQVDNLQYDSGLYDFAVIVSTSTQRVPDDSWPPLWNMFFTDNDHFTIRLNDARMVLQSVHDIWTVLDHSYTELTELDLRVGPLFLFIEDAYVSALTSCLRNMLPPSRTPPLHSALSSSITLQRPLRLRALTIHPLDLILTLHTAVRMYIALDQSPLLLGSFSLENVMTSTERLTHALTVHYLSAAILGAGWVVGGLELLGAPGALAARVTGASGGVRGVASATAAALLRSLSAWAGSLARNLDLLAGDEEHARRAAAARRRPPDSFVAGLVAGVTNFAINILGAVGGLAHHPLVGVAVGESESNVTALRRGLLGALTKPLSATADLVALAGHGLLRQTGWDLDPQPRYRIAREVNDSNCSWRRDCVRWSFRLAEMSPLAGFYVLKDQAPLRLILTHRFLVLVDFDMEQIVEMIDYRFCSLGPYSGPVIELKVAQKRAPKVSECRRGMEDDAEYQISEQAMARVARYTGQENTGASESQILSLTLSHTNSRCLHAALTTLIHKYSDTHFSLI